MKTATPCPNVEELHHLVEGSLSSARQEECTEHIDACPCCQAKLDEIATGGTNFSRILERLHEEAPVAGNDDGVFGQN